MTRRLVFLSAALVLALAVPALPIAGLAGETILVPNDAYPALGQQQAITEARQRIAAGDMDGAVKQLADYVSGHPDATEAARFLGDLYYRQGHFDQAEAVYKQLLAKDPRDKETHNRLGVVYATQNNVDDAIVQFQDALPGTDSIRDLVLLHLRKGDLPQYEAQMQRAASDNPTDSDIQEEVGEIYEAIHRPGDAITYFQRSLDSDPKSIAALNGIGMSFLDERDHVSAMRYLHECLDLDITNYACIDNLGVANIQANLFGAANDEFTRAHRLEPERPEAIVNFGYLADTRGDWKRAVTYYVQAIAVDPYVPESYVNLGIDYEHNGLYPLAQAALIKGVAAAPWDGRVRYLLAKAYAAQGQKSLALAQLKIAEASLDPDVSAIAKEELARLTAAPTTAPQ
jgi:tetratricopeptide (TPR) repeat protein